MTMGHVASPPTSAVPIGDPPLVVKASEPPVRIGRADLVVGLADGPAPEVAIEAVRSALARFFPTSSAVVLVGEHAQQLVEAGDPRLCVVAARDWVVETMTDTRLSRVLFRAAGFLGARACALLWAGERPLDAADVRRLLAPALEDGYELVLPAFARSPFDGLLNTGILYPLLRALFGKRVRWPAAPAFVVSGGLMARCRDDEFGDVIGSGDGLFIQLTTASVTEQFRVCQAELCHRWPHLLQGDAASAIVQTLGVVFSDIERRAIAWQRVRASEAVPTYGAQLVVDSTDETIDAAKLYESFLLGYRHLQPVWSLVLSPGTLLALKKRAAGFNAAWRLNDDEWARIVYDFVIGHHLRVMSREHLLRSLTPIYLAWLASFALDVQGMSAARAEQRVEQLCRAFETEKPYFVSRWRWPDRFSP